MAVELTGYREPVFTHDVAEKAWGEGYWALAGKAMLDWVISSMPKNRPIPVHGWYDHRPNILPVATRRICWCMSPKMGEIPKDITDVYQYPLTEYPQGLVPEKQEEHLLRRSWALLLLKWDTLSVAPYIFNLLLAKILAISDLNKIGLIVLDTKDLYVNINPVEWYKKYDAPYPVADVEQQKEVYDQWLTWSGFRRYYTLGKKGLITTPWYFRIPDPTARYGTSIREYPEYKVHPLMVTGGIYYPPGYEA